MQCAVIEYARNKCGEKNANSTEFDAGSEFPIIDLMPDQKNIEDKGGTMRLGKYDCRLSAGSNALQAYGTELIDERHRHRYEVNNELRNRLTDGGLKITGINPERDLVEIVEIDDHPWFTGVQFHPELKSTVSEPHPLFVAFIRAAVANRAGEKMVSAEKETV
jgi:CTP synthase